ncbi:amino acid ABC transporter permease [Chengkuizengella marina]|nr:ABC transporter permease subunit [Chengkuizengella marina]
MYLNNSFINSEFTELYNLAESSLIPLLEGALYYTIPLTIISFMIGLTLAVLSAVARISTIKFLQTLSRIYVSIIRGTPLLVQLFIIFYGLPNIGITLDPFPSAIIGFSLNVGAYGSEIIRASILSIPKGQWEAGYSIGMSYTRILQRIILPQAARVSVPPLSNTFISLVKDTSLASLVLVTELFRKAQQIAAKEYNFLLLYIEAAIIYWVICFILSLFQNKIEHRLERFIS